MLIRRALLVGALALGVPHPAPAAAVARAAVPVTFDFHNNVWINLHHFLYHLAQPPGAPPRNPAPVAVGGPLSADEQRVWDRAIGYYREHLIKRDLLFDDGMGQIKEALARADPDTVLRELPSDSELARVLNDAAPVYRRHWWPTHRTTNDLWIAAVHPLLDALGPKLSAQLETAYGTPWFQGPIRVDVSAYATRLGAYTTGTTRGHVVVVSTDPCDQGYAAVEVLFHEASHTVVDDGQGPVGGGIVTAANARRMPVPADLWHALIFYTPGEFMREDLAKLGIAYDPESGACDVYRGAWRLYRDAAALYWAPHMFGGVPLDTALSGIVGALRAAASSRHE